MSKMKRARSHLSFEDRMGRFQQPHLNTGQFWWCYTLEGGKRYVLGPFNSEDESYSTGYAKIQGDFEVIALKTRDTATATQQLKARELKRDTTLAEATRRARHKVWKVDGGE